MSRKGQKRKPQKGKKQGGQSHRGAVFGKPPERKADPLGFQQLHPHHPRQSTHGGEKGTQIGADHRAVKRGNGRGIGDPCGDLRKKHAHGDVVHQIGTEIIRKQTSRVQRIVF